MHRKMNSECCMVPLCIILTCWLNKIKVILPIFFSLPFRGEELLRLLFGNEVELDCALLYVLC